MKKTITINYCSKRTFNLGNYENIAPIHTITEEIELDEGEEYTDQQYHEDFARLKKICRRELSEEASRVKAKDMTYAGADQLSKIFDFIKKNKIDLQEAIEEYGVPSVLALSAKNATDFYKHLTQKYGDQSN